MLVIPLRQVLGARRGKVVSVLSNLSMRLYKPDGLHLLASAKFYLLGHVRPFGSRVFAMHLDMSARTGVANVEPSESVCYTYTPEGRPIHMYMMAS